MENIPVANPQIIGEYADIKDLIKKVKNYMEGDFLTDGFFVINEDTGYKIEFNSTTMGKLFSNKLGETKLFAYTALVDIIKYAKMNKKEPDRMQRADLTEIIYFDSKIMINDKIYYFGFNVRHTKQGKFIYSAVLPIL